MRRNTDGTSVIHPLINAGHTNRLNKNRAACVDRKNDLIFVKYQEEDGDRELYVSPSPTFSG